jgi:solute carrier family 25 iron transporter 28/37
VLFYVPGDVIVQRLQVANSPYKSSLDAIRKIYLNEGMKGYYRGLGATFIVSALASSIWWMTYENIKYLLYRPSILPYFIWSKSSKDESTAVHRLPQLTAGFLAGTVTSTFVNPLDVVKTRIQTQNINTLGTTSSTLMYKNMVHGLKCLWREEGVHGLMRGILPKLMSRGPLSAISALIFELVLYYSRDDLYSV